MKIKKTFILGKHWADLLEASKEKLVFELSNDDDYNTTLITLSSSAMNSIREMIYERIMCINTDAASAIEISKNISIVHKNQYRTCKTNQCRLIITTYENGIVSIMIYTDKNLCECISFKINEIEIE